MQKIELPVGEELVVTLQGVAGEFRILHQVGGDGVLVVTADVPDDTGRGGAAGTERMLSQGGTAECVPEIYRAGLGRADLLPSDPAFESLLSRASRRP